MVVVVWTGVQSPRWVPVCFTGVKEATVAWKDRYTHKKNTKSLHLYQIQQEADGGPGLVFSM